MEVLGYKSGVLIHDPEYQEKIETAIGNNSKEINGMLDMLNNLYELLKDEIETNAFQIHQLTNCSGIFWTYLLHNNVIQATTYRHNYLIKWIAASPDSEMASEIFKECPDYLNVSIKKEKNLEDQERAYYSSLLPYRNNIKSKTMLHEKDLLFNWVIPEGSGGNNIVTEDFRFNVTHNTLYLGKKFLDKHLPMIDKKYIKVAFILNKGEQPFLAINPPLGIPFFIFKSSSKGSTPSLSNKNFSLRIKEYFNLMGNVVPFTLEPFEKINGMMLFKIIP